MRADAGGGKCRSGAWVWAESGAGEDRVDAVEGVVGRGVGDGSAVSGRGGGGAERGEGSSSVEGLLRIEAVVRLLWGGGERGGWGGRLVDERACAWGCGGVGEVEGSGGYACG